MENSEISHLISDIKNDHQNGARILAEKGLAILSYALESSTLLAGCTSKNELFRELRKIALQVSNARPSMKAAIQTSVLRALREIRNTWDNNTELRTAGLFLHLPLFMDMLRRLAIVAIDKEVKKHREEINELNDQFVRYFLTPQGFSSWEAMEVESHNDDGGAYEEELRRRIVHDVNILTLSSSSTVASCLIELINNNNVGRKINLTVLESRPLFSGVELAKAVLKGIDAQKRKNSNLKIVVDSAVGITASQPDTTVVIGCDRLLSDGRVLNAVGSMAAALVAKTSGNRTIAVAETAKVTSQGHHEVNVNRVDRDCNTGAEDETAEENDPMEVYEAWKLGDEQFTHDLKAATKNRYFEWVGSDLITSYVTEIGVIGKEKLQEIGYKFAGLEKEMFGDL